MPARVEMLLFRHVQGLTGGVPAFADDPRVADRGLPVHDEAAARLVLARVLALLTRLTG